MTVPDRSVTLGIPAYQAEAFIDRTMRAARSQTHDELQIVVSIDLSTDATASICREHAAEDPRIRVVEHHERLGWAHNVNFLLADAATAFFATYFHDDLIEPEFCSHLVRALLARPDAASAHCQVGSDDGSPEMLGPTRPSEGTTFERLLRFLTTPPGSTGVMLRSMIRMSTGTERIRIPPTSVAGVNAGQPFLMALIAAGPAVGVGEVLYRRWLDRSGGLVDGWKSLGFDEVMTDLEGHARAAVELLESLDVSPGERAVLLYALSHYLQLLARNAETSRGANVIIEPEALHPALASTPLPDDVSLDAEHREWIDDLSLRSAKRRKRREKDLAR